MANDDKVQNKIDEGAGQIKETAGRAAGDEDMRQQGEAEKDKAQLKDKVQDAVDKAKGIFKK
ncbi:MAG TPA: CsbD family protein [Pseudonocardiaceae bacterium]|nr:CsbD family protein [Pseudonocardiaceae bacterium]